MDKKKTVTLVVGATVGAVAVPYVAAHNEQMIVPQLPGGLGKASALLGLGGGAAALYFSMKGKRMSDQTRTFVSGLGLGLLSTGLASAVLPYVSTGVRSGQVRRAPPAMAGAPMSTLVRASATV